MFLTENVNYNDSILFLLSARMALKESIELSDVEEKDQLKDFIVNEATDYEVMSLLVDGELPEEKYDHIKEIILFSNLKDQLVENINEISEVISPELINNVLFEVNSIYPEYTTANNIVEFLHIREADKPKTALEDKYDKIGRAASEKAIAMSKKARKEREAKVRKEGKKTERGGTTAEKALEDKYDKLGRAASEKAIAMSKKAAKERKFALDNKARKEREAKVRATAKAERAAKERKFALDNKARKEREAKKNKISIIDKIKDLAKDGKSFWGELGKIKQDRAKGIGAVVLATLAIFSAYKAYKRFFSKAAKSCSGLSGAEKTACMNKYKVDGYDAQIKELNKGLSACSKSSNPEKCKTVIQNKIDKIEAKKGKI